MVAQGRAVADEVSSDIMLRRDPVAMGETIAVRRDSQIRRAPSSNGLYDVLDLILDKGIVVDAFVRVSLVGIELITVDLRIVIASVDTYLRYAEGAERLQLYGRSGAKKLPDAVGDMKGQAMKSGAKKLGEAMTGGDDDDEDEGDEEEGEHKKGLAGALTSGVRHILKKGVGGILHNVKGDSEDDDEKEDEGGEEGEQEERFRGREASRKDGNAGRAKSGSRR